MNYDELLELVKNRRSRRRFKTDPIPAGIVEKVLEVARLVPSAGNAQPWEFVIVTDAAVKKSISKNIMKIFAKAEKLDPTLYPAAVQTHMFMAPVLIVVCADPRLKVTYPAFLKRELLFYQSLAICEYAIQLAAACFGLATAWATIQDEAAAAEVKKLLNIPDFYVVDHIIPLGYADEAMEARTRRLEPILKRAPYRKDMAEIIHYDSYDQSRLKSDREVNRFITQRTVVRIPKGH